MTESQLYGPRGGRLTTQDREPIVKATARRRLGGFDDSGDRRITKVISFDANWDRNRAYPSKALIEDPFQGIPGYGRRIPIPPFSLEQLVELAEQNPTHSACLEQKATDVVAQGPKFIAPDASNLPDTEITQYQTWWESLFEEHTPVEVLLTVWLDYETVGWGALEVARDLEDQVKPVKRLYHVPGHTLRASADGLAFVQIRQGRRMWFKKWGVDGTLNCKTGQFVDEELAPELVANEMIVFRKPSRRSTWYGIPGYVSALGAIAMAVSARDYNILFFENNREPRHVIIISGMEENTDGLEDDIAEALRTQHREPHRNLIIPLVGDANVTIKEMASKQNDMHFVALLADTRRETYTAHRMPSDRIGIVERGALGGSVSTSVNRIYKEAVVAPGQNLAEDRLQRFFMAEYERATGQVYHGKIDLEELDVADESDDSDIALAQVKGELVTLNEARARLGKPRHEPFGDMTLAEWLSSLGIQPSASAALAASEHVYPSKEFAELAEHTARALQDTTTYLDQLMAEHVPDEFTLQEA